MALEVGLVGAGPWARWVHAPTIAAGPETRLAGVWARRPDAAADLAAVHGTRAFDRFDDLLASCEAVAFAVPPDVQARMAVDAARAGKAVLLEKPVALDLDGARAVRDAVEEAGVGSLVVLTARCADPVRAFLDGVDGLDPIGGRASNLSGAFRGGPFATPWRLEHGALLDLGPHAVDLLDAALGAVVDVRAHGSSLGWIGLLLEHASGARSEVSLSAMLASESAQANLEVHGRTGSASIDIAAAMGPGCFERLRAEFAEVAATGAGHPQAATLGVERGLHLQGILARAASQL